MEAVFNFDRKDTAAYAPDCSDGSSSKRALLVVDIQKGFFSKNPALQKEFPEFESNVTQLLALMRGGGRDAGPLCKLVVHIRAGYSSERGSAFIPTFKRLNPEKILVAPETPDAEAEDFAKEIDSAHSAGGGGPTEIVLDKPTFDAFLNTDLDEQLQAAGIEEVFICGLVTEACVQATAHGSFARGYRTVLVEDCCAGRDRGRHEAVLTLYGGYMYQLATVNQLSGMR